MRFGDTFLQMCSLDTVIGVTPPLAQCPQEGDEAWHPQRVAPVTNPKSEACFLEAGGLGHLGEPSRASLGEGPGLAPWG